MQEQLWWHQLQPQLWLRTRSELEHGTELLLVQAMLYGCVRVGPRMCSVFLSRVGLPELDPEQ